MKLFRWVHKNDIIREKLFITAKKNFGKLWKNFQKQKFWTVYDK